MTLVSVPLERLPELRPVLAKAGWDLTVLEIDQVAGRVDFRAQRLDGRWVHFRAEGRGASLERWQRHVALGLHSSTKPGVAQSDQVDDVFLGRLRFATPQEGLVGLLDYLASNAPPGCLSAQALRHLLGAAVQDEVEEGTTNQQAGSNLNEVGRAGI